MDLVLDFYVEELGYTEDTCVLCDEPLIDTEDFKCEECIKEVFKPLKRWEVCFCCRKDYIPKDGDIGLCAKCD